MASTTFVYGTVIASTWLNDINNGVYNALPLKASLDSPTFTGTVSGITKSMVGLGSVDNTADTAKPVSTAQATALALKADLAGATLTGATLTSPTINTPAVTNPTITNYVETVYAPAAGSAFTVALTNGTIQKFTTNANIAITLPASTPGKVYSIFVVYGGVHTVTFSGGSTIKWAGGSAPTATSVSGKIDKYNFTCDGTNTYGCSGGSNY